MHQVRMAESGRDYLLQTYLDQLSDKVTYRQTGQTTGQTAHSVILSSLQNQSKDTAGLLDVFPQTSPTLNPCGVPPQQISHWTETLSKINKINTDLTLKVSHQSFFSRPKLRSHSFKEEEMLKLNQRTRSLSERLKSNAVVVPELEEIFRYREKSARWLQTNIKCLLFIYI